MCEIYSRWSGGKRFGHFIIFCHPCPDWRQAAARVGNLTLNIVCLTRGIGFRNLIQNRLNKLGKYWLLEISQNKKSSVDTTNYIRLEGWFVVDVGAGDGPLSRRGWAGAGYSVWSVINQQYFVNLLQTCPLCPPAPATLLPIVVMGFHLWLLGEIRKTLQKTGRLYNLTIFHQFSPPIFLTYVQNSGTVHASNQNSRWCLPWPALCLVPV